MGGNALSNRELAILIWVVAFGAWALTQQSIRRSVGSAIRASLSVKLLIPIALFALYVAGACWLGYMVGVWNWGMAKDTFVWFLIAGMALFASFPKVAADEPFFRPVIRRTFAISAFVEFYAGIVAFPLMIELILQPVIAVIAMTAVVAGMDPKTKQVEGVLNAVLVVVIAGMLGLTAIHILSSAETLNGTQLVLSLYLPILLTIAAAPFVYLIGVYAAYESAFVWIYFAARDDRKARRRAQLALIVAFKLRARAMRAYARDAAHSLVAQPTFTAALRSIARNEEAHPGT
jgi:hypothetical protein